MTCIECKIGFLAEHGEPCKPCSTNRYGSKCSNTCNCGMFERCHNVMGCIPVTTFNDHTENSINTIRSHTEKDGVEGELVNLLPDIVNETSTCNYTINTAFLYTVCTGSLAFVLVLVSSTLTYYRREKRKRSNSNKAIHGADNTDTRRATILIV